MTLKFTKMHGLGNDFMVIDAIHQSVHLTADDIAAWSRRDTGIGFDQCLLIEASNQVGVDFFYRIFNANGQEVGQCGNGARCLARFVQYYGLSKQIDITVATKTTRMQLHINSDETVTVDMGRPNFDPKLIPLKAAQQAPLYSLTLKDNQAYYVHAMSIGNPHAVMRVADLNQTPIHDLGSQISEHLLFPEQANVGFMQIINDELIDLRVYERGCGETRACGSAAVAAVAIGRRYHALAQQVTVRLPGGELIVSWPDMEEAIFLTGSATFVYKGEILP
jgi:diaminopimelate epimerase